MIVQLDAMVEIDAIVQIDINKDFSRKKIFWPPGIQTHNLPTHVFLPGICISPIDHVASIGTRLGLNLCTYRPRYSPSVATITKALGAVYWKRAFA